VALEIQYFGAQTLHTKIQQEWYVPAKCYSLRILPANRFVIARCCLAVEDQKAVLNQVLEQIGYYSSGASGAVLTRLCLCLASIVLQTVPRGGWATALPELLEWAEPKVTS